MYSVGLVPAVALGVVMVQVEVQDAVSSQPVVVDALPPEGDCDQMASYDEQYVEPDTEQS